MVICFSNMNIRDIYIFTDVLSENHTIFSRPSPYLRILPELRIFRLAVFPEAASFLASSHIKAKGHFCGL